MNELNRQMTTMTTILRRTTGRREDADAKAVTPKGAYSRPTVDVISPTLL